MSRKVTNIIGNTYGRINVISFSRLSINSNGYKTYYWNCICECGTHKEINGACLKRGTTKSCGCLNREETISRATKHLLCGTRVYHSWANMKNRCKNESSTQYRWYGGRGITVCDRWSEFENFLSDMGLPPSDKHSIDRIDTNGNYEPSNCKWSTMKEQCNNRRPRT